jgi:ribosomal protein S1
MNIFQKILAIVLVVVLLCAMAGCNKQLVDLTYSYERAIVQLPNGDIVEGKVSSWTDFEDGDQIQVKIDGKTYLVHSENIALISE